MNQERKNGVYAYLSLFVYYILLLLLSTGAAFLMVLSLAIITLLFIILYKLTEDDFFFYSYFFLSMLAVIAPFLYVREIDMWSILYFYTILIPLFMHFVFVRFNYSKISPLTYSLYLLSPVLSMGTIFLFLYLPLTLGTYIIIAMIFLFASLFYFLFTP